MLDQTKQYELAFAALLHDIGKFKQRAFGGKEDALRKDVVAMEGQLLPTDENTSRYSHRHAIWTYSFFLEDWFPVLKNITLDRKLDWEKIARESAAHHNPSADDYSKWICDGDRISAQEDRVGNATIKRGEYLTIPLRSLFANISLSEKNGWKKTDWVYRMIPMAGEGDINTFPVHTSDAGTPNYRELWDKFLQTLQALHGSMSCQNLLRVFKDLLFSYTWCIPSATNDETNDVSLYDHSITTMAFALALGNSDNPDQPFRLVVGDLSGIQKFIFQSKHDSFRGASKTFRGRSFLISMLSTAYQAGLCDALGLIPFVDLIDAGGRFTLLLPNTQDSEEKIANYQTEQEVFLLKKYLGTLCVVADASMTLGKDDWQPQKFKDILRIAAHKLAYQKTQKFRFAIKQTGFVLQDTPTEGTRCIACGVRSRIDDDSPYCTECAEEKRLGEKLPSIKHFHLSLENGRYELLKGVFLDEGPGSSQDVAYALGTPDAQFPLWRTNTYTPEEDFTDIAGKAVSEDGNGRPLLAYIKIDVDHLGEIFMHGLPETTYTLSRYVSISRLLNQFFNVHVRTLLEEKFPDVYTVISGGDDVFLIAPWNLAIPLVQQLHNDLNKYCCENPDLHFSTGIEILDAKTPFSFGNQEANIALDDKAKEEFGRNCVCFMDHQYNYDDLAELLDSVEKLKTYTTDENYPVSTAFLYRMLQYVDDKLFDPSQPSPTPHLKTERKYASVGKLRYDMARNFSGPDKTLAYRMEAASFFQQHFEFADMRQLKQFKDCLTYALYDMRTNNTKGDTNA